MASLGSSLVAHPVVRIMVSVLVIQGSLFVSGMLAVRAIGIEARGELALLSGVVGIASQVGLLGLPAALVFFISSRHLAATSVYRVIYRSLLVSTAAFALLGYIAVLALDLLGEPLTYPYLEAAMVAGGVVAIMFAFPSISGLQGEQRYNALTIVQAMPMVIYAAITAVLFFSGVSWIIAFLLASLTGWILVPVATGWALRKPRPKERQGDVPTSLEVRRFGVRSAVASASPTDLLGIDQILIGVTIGHAPLGLYVIGWAFETATVLPGTVLATFVSPKVAAAPPGQRPAIARKWAALTLLLGALACIAVQIVLAPVLVFAFGEDARGAITPARILLVAGVLLGLRRMLGYVLQAFGRPTWSTWAELVSFAVMAVGVVVFGQLFGINGCCWAMVMAGLTGVTVQLAMLTRLSSGTPADRLPSMH